MFHTQTGDYYLPKFADADVIARAIKADAVYDENIYEAAKKFIKEDSIVLDVGSNFGQMAIMFSRHVGKNGLVYAFEANHFVYTILEKNVAINAVRVKPFEEAVHTTSDETLYFSEYNFDIFDSYGSFGIDYVNSQGTPVKTIALDDLDYPLPISFMKVDAQGGDLFAMQGARKIIKKYRMPIIFEYEYLFEEKLNMQFQEYVDFVGSIGYKFVRCYGGINHLILPQ